MAAALVPLAAIGSAAFAASPGSASPRVSTTQFTCSEQGTVVGGGVLTIKEQVANDRLNGWMLFEADNGVTKRYTEHAVITSGDSGSRQIDGVFVAQGYPLYADWLFIDGSATYAPNGILGSYSGTAVDICHQLGY